ncbi:MAG: hypothetical protein NT075_33755 [Chloroflexi bacterium]|nr:hypothetical protein [Chloroflexota bacterium]
MRTFPLVSQFMAPRSFQLGWGLAFNPGIDTPLQRVFRAQRRIGRFPRILPLITSASRPHASNSLNRKSKIQQKPHAIVGAGWYIGRSAVVLNNELVRPNRARTARTPPLDKENL